MFDDMTTINTVDVLDQIDQIRSHEMRRDEILNEIFMKLRNNMTRSTGHVVSLRSIID